VGRIRKRNIGKLVPAGNRGSKEKHKKKQKKLKEIELRAGGTGEKVCKVGVKKWTDALTGRRGVRATGEEEQYSTQKQKILEGSCIKDQPAEIQMEKQKSAQKAATQHAGKEEHA